MSWEIICWVLKRDSCGSSESEKNKPRHHRHRHRQHLLGHPAPNQFYQTWLLLCVRCSEDYNVLKNLKASYEYGALDSSKAREALESYKLDSRARVHQSKSIRAADVDNVYQHLMIEGSHSCSIPGLRVAYSFFVILSLHEHLYIILGSKDESHVACIGINTCPTVRVHHLIGSLG